MYICELEDKLDRLRDAVQQLKNKQEHIKIRVKREESPYKERTYKTIDWLYRAERLESQSEKVIADYQDKIQKRCPACCCLINCRSSSKLEKRVCEKLKAVNQILTEGDFDVVVERTPHDVVDVIPVETTVDFEANLDDVWRCLEDASLGIIGIYGMAGVGKTTLMKKIKGELDEKGLDFSAVIWFQYLSKGESSPDTIQDAIASQLPIAIRSETWKNTNRQDRAAEISRLLSSLKIILMLDDLCDAVDLLKVGVPLPNDNGSKVVFSTRSEQVCNNMKAQIKLKLKCLSREEALKLFWTKAGGDIGDHRAQVKHLADTINTEVCQGLPLALTVIGRAMGGMRNPRDWEHAVSTIRNDPAGLPGMKRIFHILETSYDSLLEDDMFRDCFLYCSMLPSVTSKDELIKLWIGEGFLNVFDNNLGEYIIKRLKWSCLLESDELGSSVSMHGIFRAFGLWLASEHGQKKDKILIQEWRSEKWSNAVRVSIYGQLDVLRPPPNPCPLVQTLLIRDSNLSMFSAGFLHSMHTLGVLDLSGNMGTYDLFAGGIGSLINLHYLNLSHTETKELPIEIQNLKKLKVLLMDYTENFQVISNGVLSSVSSLQVFSKFSNGIFDDRKLLEELECIEHMADINVTLFSHEAIERMLQSGKLQRCIRKLSLKRIKILEIPISTLSRMVCLEELNVEECEALCIETDSTQYYVLYLRSLQIRQCSAINNLQWLIFAPKLLTIELRSCKSLKEIIGKDFKPEELKEIDEILGVFSNMKQLHLEDLPSLQSICPQILHFPVLKDVVVINCPRLLKLPFDIHCTKRLRQIKGSRSWLEQLHWENEEIRDVLCPKFQDCTEAGEIQQSSDSLNSSPDSEFIEEEQVPEPLNIQGSTEVEHKTSLEQRLRRTGLSIFKGKSKPQEPLIGIERFEIPWPKPFTYKELAKATNGFSIKVGEGGFGKVYRGILPNNEAIAVKEFAYSSYQQNLKRCEMEIKTVGRIHCRHVVRLLGYCISNKHLLLVYEFVPNGSLHNHLHEESKSTLKWSDRMKIAVGSAKGLAYLNEGCLPRIIHRDIKPRNILLDYDFEPKISGFELAKELPDLYTETETVVVGTFGYLDPEYCRQAVVTAKTDFYSFGVVLMELITGKSALFTLRGIRTNLVRWVEDHLKQSVEIDELIDPRLQKEYDKSEATLMIYCAAACVSFPSQDRPNMTQVVEVLQGNMSLKRIWTGRDITFLSGLGERSVSTPRSDINVQGSKESMPYDYDTNEEVFSKEGDWVSFDEGSTTTATVSEKGKSKMLPSAAGADPGYGGRTGHDVSGPNSTMPSTPRTEGGILQSSNLKSFSLNALKAATRNFSPDSILGEGGFGCVFKGWIDEHSLTTAKPGTGMAIAVKRLNQETFLGHQEWLAEINYHGRLYHPNIVKLIGYCIEDDHRLLVLEFMPRGSLNNHLFRRASHLQPLSWNLRIKVALGAAKGLAFLHSDSANVIIRDFKASNILLDSNYDAKLSDFSLAKDGPTGSESHVSTRVMGTYGYAAPEYIATGHLTKKCDVYSFGVVLLELLTGRRALDKNRPPKEQNLVEWARPYLGSKRKICQIMDARIKGQYSVKDAFKVADLALQCISLEPRFRPKMEQVVKALEKLLA